MSIVEGIKGVAKLVQQFDNIELNRKILDLQVEAMALVQDNQALRGRVADLERKWEIQEDLQFRENAYWRSSGEGPFCLPCWDGQRKLMRMAGDAGSFLCPTCQYPIGVLLDSTDPYRLWLTSEAKGAGSTCTACWAKR